MSVKVRRIPKSFAVQPLKPGEPAESRATCYQCGLSWDDGKVTSMTPAPSGRCPFEHFHVYPADKPKRKTAARKQPEFGKALAPHVMQHTRMSRLLPSPAWTSRLPLIGSVSSTEV